VGFFGTVTSGVAAPQQALDMAAISRMLTESQAIPFAVIQNGLIAFANPAFAALFGQQRGMAGRRLTDFFTFRTREAAPGQLSDRRSKAVNWYGRATRADGTSFDMELHLARETLQGVPAICVFAEDVSSRRLSESQLSSLAYSDSLTGLPNRALLLDRLRNAVLAANRKVEGIAVLMADLDGLKGVNDTEGHQAGDVLLRLMAQRFRDCTRESDTLARLGGDEFCVLLPQVSNRADAETIATRLVEAARLPVPIGGGEVRVSVSVGIALLPDHGRSADALLAAADEALYRAKHGGRDRLAWAPDEAQRPVVPLPLIVWTAAQDLGIQEIDEQHRELADRINGLAAVLQRGDDPAEVARQLEMALAYARFHFEAEERLMDAHGFKEAAAHKEIHTRLLDDLRNFSIGFDARSLSITTRYMQEWLLRHVDSSDRRLAQALQALGVA